MVFVKPRKFDICIYTWSYETRPKKSVLGLFDHVPRGRSRLRTGPKKTKKNDELINERRTEKKLTFLSSFYIAYLYRLYYGVFIPFIFLLLKEAKIALTTF